MNCPECQEECWREQFHDEDDANKDSVSYGPWRCPGCGWQELTDNNVEVLTADVVPYEGHCDKCGTLTGFGTCDNCLAYASTMLQS